MYHDLGTYTQQTDGEVRTQNVGLDVLANSKKVVPNWQAFQPQDLVHGGRPGVAAGCGGYRNSNSSYYNIENAYYRCAVNDDGSPTCEGPGSTCNEYGVMECCPGCVQGAPPNSQFRGRRN